MTRSEAYSLSKFVASFEFLLSLVVSINKVSKKLQSISMCIGTTMEEVKSLMLYFEKIRNEEFEPCMNIAETIALSMNVEPSFPIKRHITRTRQFDENDDEEIQSPEESFRINYFLVVVDLAITSLKNRYE